MRKQRKAKLTMEVPHYNPVAKYAGLFNKAQVYADKRRYQRNNKHRGMEPFSIAYA